MQESRTENIGNILLESSSEDLINYRLGAGCDLEWGLELEVFDSFGLQRMSRTLPALGKAHAQELNYHTLMHESAVGVERSDVHGKVEPRNMKARRPWRLKCGSLEAHIGLALS